jgi:hypothetical protein
MRIVVQTEAGAQTEFERDYIYNFCLANTELIKTDAKVVVFSSNRREKLPYGLSENDVLVHLSNENLKFNYRFLTLQNIILRSYYHPFVWHPNCYAIPLGWQTGYANKSNVVGNHNKYIWSFIGQIKGYRKPMYEAFKTLTPCFKSVSNLWNSGKMTDTEVQQAYLDSAFALVPFGSIHADTMRIMEVLEWGCIPVVIKYMHEDYYKYIYGNHPFILADDWNKAREVVEQLWSDKSSLKDKQEEVRLWYINFKKNLQEDITDILKGKKPVRCEQWRYQRLGRLNIWMLATWYYHFYYKKQPIY